MTRAAIYCRVSTQEQRNGWSLDGQYDRNRGYCDRHGYAVRRAIREVDSGMKWDRRGLAMVLGAVERRTIDVLVVTRRCRLGRDPAHNSLLERFLRGFGVRLETVEAGPRTASAEEELNNGVLDVVNRFQHRKTSEECQRGRDTAARAGRWPSRPPYGYRRRPDGDLEPDPETGPLVQWAYEMASQGASLSEIQARLAWPTRTISGRLHNPAYKGTATYNGTRVHIPAIVTPTTWDVVQSALRHRRCLPGTAWQRLYQERVTAPRTR